MKEGLSSTFWVGAAALSFANAAMAQESNTTATISPASVVEYVRSLIDQGPRQSTSIELPSAAGRFPDSLSLRLDGENIVIGVCYESRNRTIGVTCTRSQAANYDEFVIDAKSGELREGSWSTINGTNRQIGRCEVTEEETCSIFQQALAQVFNTIELYRRGDGELEAAMRAQMERDSSQAVQLDHQTTR